MIMVYTLNNPNVQETINALLLMVAVFGIELFVFWMVAIIWNKLFK